ncbi:MAG: hypothetical protein EOP45_22135 [Sphingobacteriaceae bacterium]|nr:MAG: hypothetical protein EOP45_22135 [Sphingobacteriaceae bacterium]
MNYKGTPIGFTDSEYIEFLDTTGKQCILERSRIYPNIRLGPKDNTMSLGPRQARMIKDYAIRVCDTICDRNGIEFEENLGNTWRINKSPF